MSVASRVLNRRELLASTAALLVSAHAGATTIRGTMPWSPSAAEPPVPVRPGPWTFFTPEEGAMVEAIVERIIPADDLGAGGRDAGCAVFIDRQLAGPYGRMEGYYMRPPFAEGTPQQGLQSQQSFADLYRAGLHALADHVRQAYAGKTFGQIPPEEQDKLLQQMEKDELKLQGVSAKKFFEQVLTNTMEGYFADPLYGGNKDMAGWKMIGFAGARYDFRDDIEKYNQKYPLPPVGIMGRAEWNTKG